jgi:hypothetical protein
LRTPDRKLQQIKENAGNPSLIGQFGVGFYSSFMVGAKVTVFTRSYKPEETGWIWSSDGVNSYDIESGHDSLARHEDRYQPKGSGSRVLPVASRGIDHPALLKLCWISH